MKSLYGKDFISLQSIALFSHRCLDLSMSDLSGCSVIKVNTLEWMILN